MFKEHPMRRVLAEEIHTRPSPSITGPAQVSQITAFGGEEAVAADREHLIALCKQFRVAAPAADDIYFRADFGKFTLKWERHTEFSTYTVFREGEVGQPFKQTLIDHLPQDWLDGLPGQVITACHIVIEGRDTPERPMADILGIFDNNPLTGSLIGDGQGKLWTDYQIHADGYHRYLIKDISMSPTSLGRRVQRLLELDTYRMMAMLAFPIAKENRPRLTEAETRLAAIIAQLSTRGGVEDERELLDELSALAAEAESIAVATTYRFSATRAYHELVKRRMAGVREGRVSGMPPSVEFLDRRLAPAMETCENLARRLESLSGRIGRASALLRTRVDVALEAQNRDLLESMNRRARLQLRLQQTVEGLSVVAISYYLLSLVSYLAKAAKAAGLSHVDPYLVTGVAFLPVVLGIWYGVRRVRHAIEKKA